MSTAILNIKQWGNNLGVRLPSPVAKAANLHATSKCALPWKMGAW